MRSKSRAKSPAFFCARARQRPAKSKQACERPNGPLRIRYRHKKSHEYCAQSTIWMNAPGRRDLVFLFDRPSRILR